MKCVVLLLKAGLTCAAAAASLQGAPAEAQQLRLGAASVALAPKGGDRGPPPASGRVEALLATAAQTNQWYSTLLFAAQPEPIYVQPISVRPVSAGLEFVLPVKKVVPTERRDVEIHYPHESPLLLSPTAFAPGAPKLARAGDWSIEIAMDRGADRFRSGVAHGSPYGFFRLTRGVPEIVAAIYADVDPKLHGAAALSTTAHLDHLVAQGKLRRNGNIYEAV